MTATGQFLLALDKHRRCGTLKKSNRFDDESVTPQEVLLKSCRTANKLPESGVLRRVPVSVNVHAQCHQLLTAGKL